MHLHSEDLCFWIGLPMTMGGVLQGNLFAMILGALLVGHACCVNPYLRVGIEPLQRRRFQHQQPRQDIRPLPPQT